MDIRAIVAEEYHRRRRLNPRYTVRAFARTLRMHHSTVSRILRVERHLSSRAVRRLGARLGLPEHAVRDACVVEHKKALVELALRRGFEPSSRWIATVTGIAVDDVNVALQLLMYERRVAMTSRNSWTLTSNP